MKLTRWMFVIECRKEGGKPRRQSTWRIAETPEKAQEMLKRDFRERCFSGLEMKILSGPTAAK